jgi:archaellum component FlaC
MTLDVQPPHDDEETTRHKFYVAITAALDNNTAAMNRIGEKLDDITDSNENVTKEFHEFKHRSEATLSTFIRGVTFLAAVLGSSLVFLFQQGYTYFDRVEKIERRLIEHEIQARALIVVPEQIQAIKSRLSEIEGDHTRMDKK